MKLIVGLGNPGPQYELTKHNVGFRVIDKLAQSLKTDFINWRSIGLIIKTQDYILAKPLTYMNQSGLLVSELVKFYKINIDDILIVYDDMDFNVGQAIMRTNGSSAGHNGLKDIFRMLQTQEIKRLKIGISRDKNSKNYVLTPFDPIQEAIIKKVIDDCADILLYYLYNDFRKAIEKFNVKQNQQKNNITSS
ncbi:aminoacyl-tRNA hydrolase [Mesomycoplasma hyorhinis]|uniref:Peptidyl-tRNA hydrolase n=3 Tax=Mesomycoplasma hyorhinis TaxID=2100 RepID=A0AAJ2YRP0_MESHY|nr:aminoacyl-tRNA hydrolase [Mesomycoplasma hyorhinis]ADM21991.1 Peptidyl-tRNA hydrolase [Mesomycoplasma hyorhinis HUB-1]AEC46173.1 peptidyl-tRNA hydrolase [Mesomycoplasma hyorhinis MCLD]AEX14312.1 peptidyl-tRNA hydrolase [Mesomycoplasma hyorhinis GDL-1]AFX74516.1 Peptidyl-tRNA hydrolase [Mesomycoplasma hyorhinis SK76]AHA41322.1 peptidyl-tRNA hydrolase [Mesomycoplasma hyorhinis DBS 1050]